MSKVHAMCTETRYIGSEHYLAGVDYHLDAERCGKYSEYFSPVSDNDRVEAEAAWKHRLAQVQELAETNRFLENVDPSIVKAAILAVQGQIEESVRVKVANAAKIGNAKAQVPA